MKKQEATLQRFKDQIDAQARFWCNLSVELGKIDLTNRQTVERFGKFLAPHVDGWGNIQGPVVISAPLVWLEDLLNDWPEFCPACSEIDSICQCQGDQ
jgi:hypothetical protein